MLRGTQWTIDYKLAEIIMPPFDIDGRPGSFSVEERRRVVAVWRAVSEQWAPFDVDVTTGGPAAARGAAMHAVPVDDI